jgi:hypothetical protein
LISFLGGIFFDVYLVLIMALLGPCSSLEYYNVPYLFRGRAWRGLNVSEYGARSSHHHEWDSLQWVLIKPYENLKGLPSRFLTNHGTTGFKWVCDLAANLGDYTHTYRNSLILGMMNQSPKLTPIERTIPTQHGQAPSNFHAMYLGVIKRGTHL